MGKCDSHRSVAPKPRYRISEARGVERDGADVFEALEVPEVGERLGNEHILRCGLMMLYG